MTMCSRSIVQRSSTAVALFWVFFNSTNVFIVTHAFSGQNQLPASAYNNPLQQQLLTRKTSKTTSSCLWLVPPPGSGYAGPELEINEMPDTYDPMMEYPGTMRPGRTPENMPFHDLPIGDDDPDPVPWPHFQQIEWHHRWAPPHPHPIPMEDFIEQQGRWATPEMEAEMRAGSRRASRTRREMEEEQKRDTLIMDDDDDDDDMAEELPQDLGEGMFGQLGSTDDAKIIADATSPEMMDKETETKSADDEDDGEDDAGLDDFLLDLGLDSLGDDDDDDDDTDIVDDDDTDDDDDDDDDGTDIVDDEENADEFVDDVEPSRVSIKVPTTKSSPGITRGLEDVMLIDDDDDDNSTEEESVNPDVTASIDVDDDDDLELGLDEDDDLDDSMEVPLEDDFDDSNDLDGENFFDDGGFDYDDGDGGGDFDGGGFD